jgi:hypothetical protein
MPASRLAPRYLLRKIVVSVKSAFTFSAGVDSDDERASRRYFGLALIGLGLLLSTWSWTLAGANYAAALDDLLRLGRGRPASGLNYAIPWAIGLYSVDTVMYIACYFGFGLLMGRQLQRLLQADLGAADGVPRTVSYFVRWFLRIAVLLLIALAVSDAAENVRALLTLFSSGPTPNPAKVFTAANAIKGILIKIAAVWILIAVLLWITGAAIAAGSTNSENPKIVRRRLRDELLDVLMRTRYCFLSVVIYAVLMLGIDQAQDVLAGLASFVGASIGVALVLLAAVALGVFALHTYSHAVWVWARLLVRLKRPFEPERPVGAVVTFSKWWGRLLGAAPWFVVLVLCVRTAGGASQVGDVITTWLLLGAGLAATAWGVGFILYKEIEGRRLRPATTHYAAEDSEAVILQDPAYRFLWIKQSPLWIPVVAIAGILLVRAWFVFLPTSDASHALAAISFGFALWTCVINRLALNTIRSRFPWITALLIVIAALAGFGFTQNHVVLSGRGLELTSSGAHSLRHMFWLTFWLSIGAAVGYALWTQASQIKQTGRRMLASWLIVLAWTGAVLTFASLGQAPPGSAVAVPAEERPTLQSAVTDWIKARAASCGDCTSIPIYFVSAEGGGIRAAYYTARVLAELSAPNADEPDPKMSQRLFSLSGVSGGSLGAMAWRLCLDESPGAIGDCVQPLGAQDLLTPLASAWLYEDALALVLPTSQCKLPGCGFLDRGSWFERSLEKGVPAFAEPLPAAAPYVFLNSTWVETGERAIASNLQIEPLDCVRARHKAARSRRFPDGEPLDCATKLATARDQLFEIGAPARASTLAHNSARFPYFNPIGYIKNNGHLADGGYFENSGTQSTADIVSEFVRQLTCEGEGCALGDAATVKNLRDKVSITTIMIRNGVRGNADPAESGCASPRARSDQNLFANAAGPVITALNATGIGAPNRVAQCNLQRLLTTLKERFPRQATDGGYIDVRLINEETLYPLGWYLSPAARSGIFKAAQTCAHETGLIGNLVTIPAEPVKKRCFERMH